MIREVSLALLFCGASTAAYAQVVAKVGGKEITAQEFKAKYEQVRKETINPPTPEVFLDDLVRFEMGIQEAEKRKIESDPAVKDKMRQELYKAFIEKELGKNVDTIKVNEAEMREFYKSNPEIRSSHILIEFKPDATPEQKEVARKRALEILAEVKKSSRPFEELVRLYSDDSRSKTAGGDVGFQNRVTIVPTYYEAILKAKVNEIVGPIQTLYGFHIVKVTARRAFQDADRSQIRMAVFNQKRRVLFDQFFKKISSRYSVTKYPENLKSIK